MNETFDLVHNNNNNNNNIDIDDKIQNETSQQQQQQLRDRIKQLQYKIHKIATESISSPSSSMNNYYNNTTTTSIVNDTNTNNQATTTTTTATTTISDDTTTSLSSSFLLGMELFGNINIVQYEENVRKQLDLYEQELLRLEKDIQIINTNNNDENLRPNATGISTTSTTNTVSSSQSISPFVTTTTTTIPFLQMKIHFLQLCSIARSKLDESIQILVLGISSSSTSSATAVVSETINIIQDDYKEWNTNTNNNDNEDQYVQSTKLLLQSYTTLQQAYTVVELYHRSTTTNNNTTTNNIHLIQDGYEEQQQKEQEQQEITYLYTIYDTIQSLWRRQKMDIYTKLIHIWNTTISLSNTNLCITTPTTIEKNNEEKNHSTLRTVLDVYDILYQYDHEQQQQEQQTNHRNMIQTLLEQFTYRINHILFIPILQHLQQQQHQQQQEGQNNLPFTFNESSCTDTNTNTNALLSSSTSTSKTVEYRLEWTTTSYNTSTTNKDYNNNNNKKLNSPSGGGDDGNHVQYHNLKDAILFIQRVYKFIAHYILFVPNNTTQGGAIPIIDRPCIRYIQQRFFGYGTNVPDVIYNKLHGLTLINGNEMQKGYYIPRFDMNDDGLFIYPFIEMLEKVYILPLTTTNGELEPKDVHDQLIHISTQLHDIIYPFLIEMKSVDMISEEGQNRIKQFISNIDEQYVMYRRCYILNTVRDMIKQNDFHNTIQVGENVTTGTNNDNNNNTKNKNSTLDFLPYHIQQQLHGDGLDIFKLHESYISTTAYKIIQTCRETMDEAVRYSIFISSASSSNKKQVEENNTTLPYLQTLPGILYRTAREILDLYRAMIPIQYGYEIHNVPRTAAIYHNDGVYMAYHCLTLGIEYKKKFPTTQREVKDEDDDDVEVNAPHDDHDIVDSGKFLHQTCMFIDMVPLFRDLAERSLNDMIQVQSQQITDLVKERISLFGYALKSNEVVSEWGDADQAYQAGMYHLRHIYQNWLPPILSYDIFHRSIGHLIDVLLALYIDQITTATDISSVACPFVHSLFQRMIYDINILWNNTTSQQKQYYTRNWDKFIVIGQFMNMSMTDIQNGLSEGIFRSVTAPELSKLIQSCFDDTPKRRNLLKLLSSN